MTAPRACVIGWPIAHSRSPLIHNYWLRRHGLEGEYVRHAVAPDDLTEFLRNLPRHGFVGCNVTQPHKEAAFAAVAIADQATARLKVVNTVYLRDARPHGTSTDGEGFLASLHHEIGDWPAEGRQAVLLGAGGAARAIAGALIDAGMTQIAVVNRDQARAAAMRDDFGKCIRPLAWSRATDALVEADLLINATSLGMTGHPPLEIDLRPLPARAVVADIVYTPLETPLLTQAKARGLRVVPGLGMLLHQAVRGFQLWFGVKPEVTAELYRLVAADLGRGR